MRFHFFADRLLEQKELNRITKEINSIISHHYAVNIEEMSYQDAIASGAKAFFEDKYPEIVRVVKIQDLEYDDKNISVELCGGTHVSDTSQIGAFYIIEQSTVAAGIKRIVALTGTKVVDHLSSLDSELQSLANKVAVPKKQLESKIDKILAEQQSLDSRFKDFFASTLQSQKFSSRMLGEAMIDEVMVTDNSPFAQEINLLVEMMKSLRTNSWLVCNDSGQYAFSHPQAKQILKEL